MTATYTAGQQLVAASLSRDLIELVRQLFDAADAGGSWAPTRAAVASLVRDRRRRSANLAARYYVDLRQTSVPPQGLSAGARREERRRPFRPEVRLDPETGWAHTTLGSSADVSAATRAIEGFDLEPTGDDGVIGDEDAPDEGDPWEELGRIADLSREEIEDLNDDRADATLNATGIGSFKKAVRAGHPPEKAVDTMAVNMTGSATTLALEGGREVIHEASVADDEALGWARVPGGDFPCGFCAMLVSRGAVYRNLRTAGAKADKNFIGDGMFKFHNLCQCKAVPVFDPDDPILDAAERLYDDWLRETRGTSQADARAAWDKYWTERMARKREQM